MSRGLALPLRRGRDARRRHARAAARPRRRRSSSAADPGRRWRTSSSPSCSPRRGLLAPAALSAILAASARCSIGAVRRSSAAAPARPTRFMYVWVALYAGGVLRAPRAGRASTWSGCGRLRGRAGHQRRRPSAGRPLAAGAGTTAVAAALIHQLTPRAARPRATTSPRSPRLANRIGGSSEISAAGRSPRRSARRSSRRPAPPSPSCSRSPRRRRPATVARGTARRGRRSPARGRRGAARRPAHGQARAGRPARRAAVRPRSSSPSCARAASSGLLARRAGTRAAPAERADRAPRCALFAAEAGVALERIADQSRDARAPRARAQRRDRPGPGGGASTRCARGASRSASGGARDARPRPRPRRRQLQALHGEPRPSRARCGAEAPRHRLDASAIDCGRMAESPRPAPRRRCREQFAALVGERRRRPRCRRARPSSRRRWARPASGTTRRTRPRSRPSTPA